MKELVFLRDNLPMGCLNNELVLMHTVAGLVLL